MTRRCPRLATGDWRLATGDWRLTPSSLFHRQPNRIAPLGPRAVVVPHVVEAQQIGERKPGVRRALSDAAVGDGVGIGPEAVVLLVQLLELAGRPERVRLRIDGLGPG